MKANEVLRRLEAAIEEAGSQAALADRLGISRQFVNDVRAGRKEPSDKILAGIGLRREIVENKPAK